MAIDQAWQHRSASGVDDDIKLSGLRGIKTINQAVDNRDRFGGYHRRGQVTGENFTDVADQSTGHVI